MMNCNIKKEKDHSKEWYRGLKLTNREMLLLQFRDAEWEKFLEEERGDLCRVVMETMLLAAARRYHLAENGMKALYEDALVLINEARAQFREYGTEAGNGYEICRTGKNVENYAIREELRKLGVDVANWESEVECNAETGEVVIGGKVIN